ncbi:MAG: hypothetical protein ABFD97_12675 [Syntrophobacter sp.]
MKINLLIICFRQKGVSTGHAATLSREAAVGVWGAKLPTLLNGLSAIHASIAQRERE